MTNSTELLIESITNSYSICHGLDTHAQNSLRNHLRGVASHSYHKGVADGLEQAQAIYKDAHREKS